MALRDLAIGSADRAARWMDDNAKRGSGDFMRSMRIAVLVGVMVVLGALPAAAQGALVLDQSEETPAIGFVLGDQDPTDEFPRFQIAQTFTAGLTGPLVKVELYLNKLNTVVGDPPPPLPITVELRLVTGLDPSTIVLATATIPASAIPIAQAPAWVPATFASPGTVVAGDHYAIVAYTDSAYAWSGTSGAVDAYDRGSARVRDASSPAWRSGCGGGCTPDMAFRTFVALQSLPAHVNLSTTFTLGSSAPLPSPVFAPFAYGSRPQVPIMGDWDGDGTRTVGAYKGGEFNLNNQNDASAADLTFAFGDPRGFPVVGDYDGDGTEDVAVYRNGLWQVRLSTGDTYTTTFGAGTWPATVPVAGDWDGDGTDGIGTYNYATATWALRNDPTGTGGADASFVFGTPNSSYPVPGDWNFDGTTTVGVKTGTTWALRDSNTAGLPERGFIFGGANDLPLTWRTPPIAG
jgi:hypothetical protein